MPSWGTDQELVAHRTAPSLSAAGPESAQNPVKAVAMGETMGPGQAQVVPPLEPRADAAAAAITGGLAATREKAFDPRM